MTMVCHNATPHCLLLICFSPHCPLSHTIGKVTNSQVDITKESQEFCPFPAGDHKTSINRRARKHYKNKIEI